ncbi:MAG: hypothetical protein FJX25_17615 [Alphaproteobacteria bacterium]|nr:hypothetical protein [Alphaproteobacteria bacterium]
MNGAMLTFDGLATLAGHAEATADYFEFRTNAALSNVQLNELHRATIEIDGRTEGVLVESTDRLDPASTQRGAASRLLLTLRRNTASTSSTQEAQ